MKKYNHAKAIKDYISFEDLLQKAGYKQYYQPKIGSLGRALLKASNNQRSDNFLKRYWDSYFRKLRQEYKHKGNF